MKTVPVLILCAALLLAACTVSVQPTDTAPGAQATAITPIALETLPPRPSIEMISDGETLAGIAGAYCWLQAANDIRCEPDPLNLEPAQAIRVATGDTLTFSLQGQEATPGDFYAVLLDDADGGAPPRVDFGAVTSANYEVDLGPGIHRFDVFAEFPDISGDNSFVSYVFAIEVPESVVEAPSETPVVAASATPRPATATPAEVATEATSIAAKPTEAEATATEAMATEVSATEMPATEVMATEVMAETATPLPSATPPPSPTVAATLPPSPTPPPTATPQTVPEFGGTIPEVVVVNGGQTYVASGAQICPPDSQSEEDCVGQPASPESERILIANGDTLRIDLAGNGPSSLTIALNNNNLTQEINRLELPGSTIALYTIDVPPDNYVLVVTAVWPDDGVATYFFRLQVQD